MVRLVGIFCATCLFVGTAYAQSAPPSQAAQDLANAKVSLDVSVQTLWQRVNALYQEEQQNNTAKGASLDKWASCAKDDKCWVAVKNCDSQDDCMKKMSAK